MSAAYVIRQLARRQNLFVYDSPLFMGFVIKRRRKLVKMLTVVECT